MPHLVLFDYDCVFADDKTNCILIDFHLYKERLLGFDIEFAVLHVRWRLYATFSFQKRNRASESTFLSDLCGWKSRDGTCVQGLTISNALLFHVNAAALKLQ